ncbi:hypothetical protein SAMN04488107_2961 [Geodermatophilus saharensis]|uniref:Uncharacterized protein n=1 Tax=Geodermatophilus saharensis TaxID=1137994 RepID=A0A239FCB9_9ACTN|nr:hypothetical protein [Geodermatophilus saharensis]SNS54700.1 hypothetical protein SAMN04488107_2961 [Geodermatophilus saharensis]
MSKDTTPSAAALTAYQAKRAEREAEEARHARAQDAVERAKQTANKLKERNSHGDAGITALDLVKAEAEVPRLEGLASHAAADVERARTLEAEALATYLAEIAPERLDKAPKAEHETAAKAITVTLARLVEQVQERNTVIRALVEDAKEAGVVPGAQNDDRITYSIEWSHPKLRTIRVDGLSATEAQPTHVIMEVLTQAIEASGYRLTSPGYIELKKLEER